MLARVIMGSGGVLFLVLRMRWPPWLGDASWSGEICFVRKPVRLVQLGDPAAGQQGASMKGTFDVLAPRAQA